MKEVQENHKDDIAVLLPYLPAEEGDLNYHTYLQSIIREHDKKALSYFEKYLKPLGIKHLVRFRLDYMVIYTRRYKRQDLYHLFKYCHDNPKVKYIVAYDPVDIARTEDEEAMIYRKLKNLSIKLLYVKDTRLNAEDDSVRSQAMKEYLNPKRRSKLRKEWSQFNHRWNDPYF